MGATGPVITHIHPVCQQANALFAMAIAHTVVKAAKPKCCAKVAWSRDMDVDASLLETVEGAAESPPGDFDSLAGWVLVAFRNALWQLLHADTLEQALVDTVMRGGDTDTNAAIAGALLGAVYRGAIPKQWAESVLNCRPDRDQPDVFRPRPERFWPVDALELAASLIGRD